MYDIDDINEIQIDHTTRCNLGCPQCARTQDNWSQAEENKNIDLTIKDYEILLSPFKKKAPRIFHCGNFGDALASPTFDETFDYTLSKNPSRVTIATNGALRPESWWRDLAQKGGDKLRVTFAIDGLEDTNHIYRIGARWEKILRNVRAFIDSGGKARWDFIEFEHNYHQIEEARVLAEELGFEKFNVKYTARFASRDVKKDSLKDGKELVDKKDNENQKDLGQIKQEYGSFQEYVNKTEISCKYKKDNKLFVDMHLRLWPCCWFGAPLYFTNNNPQTPDFKYLEKLYGPNFNSMRKHGWEVLSHDFFQNYLEKSWDNPSEKYRRIYTCGRTCGEKFEFSSGYGKNQNIRVIQRNLNEQSV